MQQAAVRGVRAGRRQPGPALWRHRPGHHDRQGPDRGDGRQHRLREHRAARQPLLGRAAVRAFQRAEGARPRRRCLPRRAATERRPNASGRKTSSRSPIRSCAIARACAACRSWSPTTMPPTAWCCSACCRRPGTRRLRGRRRGGARRAGDCGLRRGDRRPAHARRQRPGPAAAVARHGGRWRRDARRCWCSAPTSRPNRSSACEQAGARAFLAKPVSTTRLLDTLADIAIERAAVQRRSPACAANCRSATARSIRACWTNWAHWAWAMASSASSSRNACAMPTAASPR